eukprot:COSAG04_NODE_61_length_30104_cov_10.610932_24_plen_206_part_00
MLAAMDLKPGTNLLDLLESDVAVRADMEPHELDAARSEARSWIGRRAKVRLSDVLHDPTTEKRSIWQLLEPVRKGKKKEEVRAKLALIRRTAAAELASTRAEPDKQPDSDEEEEPDAEAALAQKLQRVSSAELRSRAEAVSVEAAEIAALPWDTWAEEERLAGHFILMRASEIEAASEDPQAHISLECVEGAEDVRLLSPPFVAH